MIVANHGIIAGSYARGGVTDPATVAEYWFEASRTGVLTAGAGMTGSITSTGGTATFTGAAAHGFVTGESVAISGTTPSGYNGTYSITVTGATTFTFAFAQDGSGTGSTAKLASTPQISAWANSGTAGTADLSQATIAAQLKQYASDAVGSRVAAQFIKSGLVALGGATTYYWGLVFTMRADQTNSTLRGLAGWGRNQSDRAEFALGQFGGDGTQKAVVITQWGGKANRAFWGSDLLSGSTYFMEALWTGTTLSAWMNGSAMTDNLTQGTDVSAPAATNNIVVAGIPGSETQFSAPLVDYHACVVAESDISATVRAWVTQEYGISFS